MADQKTVWLYIYSERNDFEGPAFIVFAKEEDAVKHAAEVIKGIAIAEQTSYEWTQDDPNPDELAEILKDIQEGRLKDAVAGWDQYQHEYDHDETITIQQAPFFE